MPALTLQRRQTPDGGRVVIGTPGGPPPAGPRPLVLILHWGGPVTPFHGAGLVEGLHGPALSEMGAVLAAPDCRAGDWANARSAEQVLALLDWLEGEFDLDPGRRLLSGYSMGGIGCWYLGQRYPERFSAAAILAAQPPADLDPASWRLPLALIHGRNDELFQVGAVEQAAAALRAAGKPVQLNVVEGATHFSAGSYGPALRQAGAWLRAGWERGRWSAPAPIEDIP